MTDDVWRITRKVNGTQMCLASSAVDGYVKFYYTNAEEAFGFDLQDARVLHSALGAMLPEMKDVVEAAPAKSVAVAEQPAPQKEHAGARWTKEEDAKLVASLKAGKTITDLSQMHSRSPSAIISRLHKNDIIKITIK